ncbi:MAG: hypothetical protein ACRDTS_16510 [Mycobacterium sp.]
MSRSSEDGGSYAVHLEDLDVPDATCARPDLTTFCRLDELGLEAIGQRLDPDAHDPQRAMPLGSSAS